MASRNLINAERVTKAFGRDPVLATVSLGVAEGDRVGVVGRNGGGKSTLLKVLAGRELPDDGRISVTDGTRIGLLSQVDADAGGVTVRDRVLGDRPDHDWAADALTRTVLTELLGGFTAIELDRSLTELSGGERRRVELAALLLDDLDVLILDEPTNHLDVEAVAWLADHLRQRRRLALVVVTHDRWFLDEVSDRTWEVGRGNVEEYEGGYSAYVLAKAERDRQAEAADARRRNLLRKELAWLRRGAPARTAKPKFRIDAATALIAAEPPPRDGVQLLRFAGARLGSTVLEMHDVSLRRGEREVLDRVDWNIGPGDRIGILGVNGAGKTSLVRLLLGELAADGGRVVRGRTISPAFLSQHLDELDPGLRLLAAVEDVARSVRLADGREMTASQLCERLGFGADRQWTPVGDLSGGERRRLQLTRLLMGEPNVLVLDEPTNDFDVETLAALEDLLDSFGGTLLVISHDRYFLERVCDTTVGLLGDGKVRHLPGGVDEYLRLRRARRPVAAAAAEPPGQRSGAADQADPQTSAERRSARKEMARLERAIAKLDAEETALHADLVRHATDPARVAELNARLLAQRSAKEDAEEQWLQVASTVED